VEDRERDQLVKDHIGLATFLYKRYYRMIRRGHIDPDDVYSLSLIQLVRASRTFDPARSPNFHTHATMVIKGRLLDLVRAARHKLRREPETESIDQHFMLDRTAGRQQTEDVRPELSGFMAILTPRERAAVKAVFLLKKRRVPTRLYRKVPLGTGMGPGLAKRWGVTYQAVHKLAYAALRKMQDRAKHLAEQEEAHRRRPPSNPPATTRSRSSTE
jgi:RNA polymerase sigma factor (sigma-70 family)